MPADKLELELELETGNHATKKLCHDGALRCKLTTQENLQFLVSKVAASGQLVSFSISEIQL